MTSWQGEQGVDSLISYETIWYDKGYMILASLVKYFFSKILWVAWRKTVKICRPEYSSRYCERLSCFSNKNNTISLHKLNFFLATSLKIQQWLHVVRWPSWSVAPQWEANMVDKAEKCLPGKRTGGGTF